MGPILPLLVQRPPGLTIISEDESSSTSIRSHCVAGVGMDDMFVMLAAWRHTDFQLPVRERMARAFCDAAVSITVTSLTDVLVIGIGAISPFRAVRIFCAYTGLAIAFDYFYQITFFAACLVLTGRREAANQHAITCRRVLPYSETSRWRSKSRIA